MGQKYKTFGKNRSLRIKDFDYSQEYFIYYLTLCTLNKKCYFINNTDFVQKITKVLKNYIEKYNYNLIVYCFMPDHLHFLTQANNNAGDLRDLIRDFKKFSTKCFWKSDGKEKLWQRGYYEHVLRKSEDINKIAYYILNNPVRKKLVHKWEDYPHSEIVNPPV